VAVAVEAINIGTKGVYVTWGLHVCYGNRYARPSWEGHADKLIINPDCGLRHLFADVARSKLAVMVEGTATVRRTLPTEHPATSTEKPVTTEHLWTSSEPTVEQGA
jgi:methionine synthase II (cobalamin-independent)